MSKDKRTYKIGEVYYMDFGSHENNEQSGLRPGIIFQNNKGNTFSPNVIALPLTTALKKIDMPTHVVLPSADTGLPRNSMVLCENPVCISKSLIGEYITTIPDAYMEKVAVAHVYATASIAFIDPTALLSIWKNAASLNTIGGE